MDKFKVILPSPLLAPYVKQYWILEIDNPEQGSQRFVPFGNIALFFHRTESKHEFSDKLFLSSSCISGQITTYTDLVYSGRVNLVGIVFQAMGARAFFKGPMMEINNQVVTLDELNDKPLLELKNQIAAISDDKICIDVIESFLIKRINSNHEFNYKRLSAVICSMNRGEYDLLKLAEIACLGYKQFKRIFSEHVGINPKDFLRITRFQRILYLLQQKPHSTLLQLADECDYYDKSHLIREFKEFSGFTPGRFL